MPKRMIIDASHREETRVVVLDGHKVEEFDFEAAAKRPLKGNIYLAKVTRVEPSLQAAFVEYGGNRQGFLAFAEIHPDYYQIPIADRLALIAEREEEARRRSDDDVESVDVPSIAAQESAAETAAASVPDLPEANGHDGNGQEASGHDANGHDGDGHDAGDFVPEEVLSETPSEPLPPREGAELPENEPDSGESFSSAGEEPVFEQQGDQTQPPAQAKLQSVRASQKWARRRHYKIQEVIKRRQVILVQVVKEERGNKGAALTTYLSLAGRYCVLMPNTPRGGGISRKITSAADRTRLKSAAQSLELPEGMGLIIRTAGENRTKAEIKRDYEYLLRMWDTIRELTLRSNAPACVYEEGDLVKRAIRDLYNKDISEILVEGEDGYRNAKDFMRMLMPSHAKNVKLYKDPIPLFQRYQIEAQLDAMFTPTVTLRSGGYIVINQTEALVSIDVNSGRATREHSIEDTAYKTNLEAADEIARQLRLRDLAGLIVIDFIDMEDGRNDRNVEKRFRDAVKNDRARVQIGRISQFGLLEMSRQRLRAGVVAGSTIPCPHCGGQGIVRSIESTALRVMRGLEEEAQRQRSSALAVRAPTEVAIYALNKKRREIAHMETEYDLTIRFEARTDMIAGTFEIERVGQRHPEEQTRPASAPERISAPQPSPSEQPESRAQDENKIAAPHAEGQAGTGPKRRRRRRRGRDRDRTQGPAPYGVEAAAELHAEPHHPAGPAEPADAPPVQARPADEQNGGAPAPGHEGSPGRKRRRRRRGRRGSESAAGAGQNPVSQQEAPSAGVPAATVSATAQERQTRADFPESDHPAFLPNAPSEPVWSLTPDAAPAIAAERYVQLEHAAEAPSRREERPAFIAETDSHRTEASSHGDEARLQHAEPPVVAETAIVHEHEPPAVEPQPESPPSPPKRGWWQRPFRERG